MSKKTKYPSYSGGAVSINGNTVSSISKKKNKITSSYNMTDSEKDIYDGIQTNLSDSLNNLFSISDEKQELWNKELNTYKQAGIKEIGEIYTPMINNLKNDIASRFGNLDNSIFMENLNNITDKQAQAVANLSDNLISKQDELYSTELTNRLNYISLLSNLNTTMNNNMMNYLQMAQANSTSGNNYNQNKYNAENSSSGILNSIIGAVGNIGSTALSFVNPLAGSAAKTATNIAKKST